MEKINVLKVAISGRMFLTCSFKELLIDNDSRTHKNVVCTRPVHADLDAAFQKFKPHLALICEEISNEDFINAIPEEYDGTQSTIMEMGETVPAIKARKAQNGKKQLTILPEEDTKWLDRFDILAVEMKYTNGIPGIVLVGQKQLSTGKWMGLNSPLIKENDPDYKHLSLLFEDAELLKYEVSEYIINHKYAPPADPELEFPDGPPEGEDSLFNIAPAPKDFTESVAEQEKDSNFIIRPAHPDMDDEQPF